MPISIDIRSETFHAFGEPSSWNPRSPEVRWDAVDSPTSRSQLAHQALGTGICVDPPCFNSNISRASGKQRKQWPSCKKASKMCTFALLSRNNLNFWESSVLLFFRCLDLWSRFETKLTGELQTCMPAPSLLELLHEVPGGFVHVQRPRRHRLTSD